MIEDQLDPLFYIMAPLLALVIAGLIAAARRPRRPWRAALVLFAMGTGAWLVYVGLYEHETLCGGPGACPTVYGYDAPLEDGDAIGEVLLLAGFVIPAAWAGWRGLAPPLTVGAALALGPTALALWTAPRGDNDGLWVLIFMILPMIGGLAAILAAVTERVGAKRASRLAGETELARPSDRLTALAIDIAIVWAVSVAPLTALSHRKLEVLAGAVGVGLGTVYLSVPLAWKGRTLGQALVGVFVFDARTGRPVSVVRAVLRSLVVVLEVAAAWTVILAVPALVELATMAANGRTLTDRLFGTVALSTRRPEERPLIGDNSG